MSTTGVFLSFALCILVVPYAVWSVLRLQPVLPLVVVQFLCGVIAGPSVLGSVAPQLWHMDFIADAMASLSGLAWIAAVLFAFLIGIHVSHDQFSRYGVSRVFVACGILVATFAIGTGVTLYAFMTLPEMASWGMSPGRVAVAVGLCASVTALPVLGAILREVGLFDAPMGLAALSCAAINDGLLWIILGVLLSSARMEAGGAADTAWLVARVMLFVAAILFVVRPLLQHCHSRITTSEDAALLAMLCLGVAMALVSEMIGSHHVFGAFLAGAAVPRALRLAIIEKLEPMTVVMLLPFFFTVAGLNMRLSVEAPGEVAVFVGIVALAETGKFAAAASLARMAGSTSSEAFTFATLMLTKGAVDLVVLAILVQAHILPPAAAIAVLIFMVLLLVVIKPVLRGMQRLATAPA